MSFSPPAGGGACSSSRGRAPGPSHAGPYSPRKFTPLRSPSGKTRLRNARMRPQNIVVAPVFESRRRRSLSMRRSTSALPFCGTIPTVRRSACASIQEKMCEQELIVWVSSRSWRTVNGNVASHASERAGSARS